MVFPDHRPPRVDALKTINEELRKSRGSPAELGLRVQTVSVAKTGETRLLARRGDVLVKVEVNTVMRGTVDPTQMMPLSAAAGDPLMADQCAVLTVVDHMLLNREAPHIRPEIGARPPSLWEVGQQRKSEEGAFSGALSLSGPSTPGAPDELPAGLPPLARRCHAQPGRWPRHRRPEAGAELASTGALEPLRVGRHVTPPCRSS